MRTSSSYGRLIVVAGPSGAGKTTLARHLVNTFADARFSVSTTTRAPRGDERQGSDYDFVDEKEFRRRLDRGFFLEWAEVHGSLYGTDRQWVRKTTSSGRSVVLDIDVQGAMQVREKWPGAVLVFVLPPSAEELRARLTGRGTDDAATVERRMEAAAREVRWLGAFDYFVLNGSREKALQRMEDIYRSTACCLRWSPYPVQALEYHGCGDGLDFWDGRKVVVSAGPTREPLDDVRFLSNRASGLMGCMLASSFRDAGASVTLVAGPMSAEPPAGVDVVGVETALQMGRALREHVPGSDLLAMAAAVSDFRPAARTAGKMDRSKGAPLLDLEPSPDLLAELDAGCPVLAFALEMGEGREERALAKMRHKGAFAVFLNRGDLEGLGMESPANAGVLLGADGGRLEIPPGSKRYVAETLTACLGRWLGERDDG